MPCIQVERQGHVMLSDFLKYDENIMEGVKNSKIGHHNFSYTTDAELTESENS